MDFKVQLINEKAKLPKYAHDHDAAFDVYSCETYELKPQERRVFKLGFCASFDPGYVCLVWDRSGLAAKNGVHTLAGVIDAGYRDEYGVVLLNTSDQTCIINEGDRIAQMLIQPVERVQISKIDQLSETDRKGGFGSTGR